MNRPKEKKRKYSAGEVLVCLIALLVALLMSRFMPVKWGIAKQMEDERERRYRLSDRHRYAGTHPGGGSQPHARSGGGAGGITTSAARRYSAAFLLGGMPMERRITVFCGNFGSGKTELAYAYSKALRQGGEPVTLVDLDLVNPYFTSGNQRSALAEQGIRVIAPQYLGGDVPSIPPEVFSAFSGSGRVVFDLGGDPIGAVAMAALLRGWRQLGERRFCLC